MGRDWPGTYGRKRTEADPWRIPSRPCPVQEIAQLHSSPQLNDQSYEHGGVQNNRSDPGPERLGAPLPGPRDQSRPWLWGDVGRPLRTDGSTFRLSGERYGKANGGSSHRSRSAMLDRT